MAAAFSLTLNSVSLSAGVTQLIDSASAHVSGGHRVAVVGPNGCGKSTLLRALGDPDSSRPGAYYALTAGSVDYGGSGEGGEGSGVGSNVLHVEQDNLKWSHLLGGDEEELRSLPLPDAIDLSFSEGNDAALDDAESWRALSVAAGSALHWDTADYDSTPLGELSPGCAVRAYLAVALARHSIDLLLLDEPTNHLDLPSVLWLQASIIASGKTVLIVSHDAAFLDAVCDHIWDIDPVDLSLTTSGSVYSDYRYAQELERERQAAAYNNQQKRNKQLTEAADKLKTSSSSGMRFQTTDKAKLQRNHKRDRSGRSGRKAKALEKIRDSEELLEAPAQHDPLHIDIEPLSGGVDASLILRDVVLGYPGCQPLATAPLSMRIDFGEVVAIVGYNGVGKSTLLKTLTGQLSAVSGDASVGRDLVLGNLMQEHENLPRELSAHDHIAALTGLGKQEAGKALLRLGLTKHQVESPIAELNPGARARALLASFSLRGTNALILDEPTNHLDEEAIAEILATLRSFAGTALVVSHSLSFLRSLEFSAVYQLSPEGLVALDSLEDFVGSVEDTVADVVDSVWR